MNYYKWINKNCDSLAGKTIAISGSTGGLGVCLCDYFAYLGANIIFLNRNPVKSQKLIEDLKIKYPNLNAKHITVDLEDFEKVKLVVEQLKNFNLDYLVLNAGAYKIPRHKCQTGYDNVFQINFISPFYIAYQLNDSIESRGGRVIAVSSIAHNYSKIDINDIDFSTRKAASLVYGNAKRMLTAALFLEFSKSDLLSIVHPGITLTNITAHYPKWIFNIIKHPMKFIFMPPKKAALSLLCGLYKSTGMSEWIGPKFFNIWGLPRKKKLKSFTEFELKNVAILVEKLFKSLK